MAKLAAHKTDDSVIDLTPEDFPAIFADRPADYVSNRYVHIRTSDLVPIAKESNWEWCNAGSKGRRAKTLMRNADAGRTVNHFVVFRPSDHWLAQRGLADKLRLNGGINNISNAIPRLVVYNSHDRCILPTGE